MIRNVPVDASRLPLVAATSEPIPVQVWAELTDGSRRPVPESQQKDDAGRPLWTVETLFAEPGQRAEVVSVQVASHDVPRVTQYAPVPFVGLAARVSKGRDGSIRMYWSAEGVQATPVRKADS
ncbi:MAG: hypothetical protein AB7I38_18005 [Dehalococcoidia bacterium]